jgi:hypothetical protein
MEAKLAVGEQGDHSTRKGTIIDNSPMIQKRLHEIGDWQEVIPEPLMDDKYSISKWLNELFGNSVRRDSKRL